MLPQIGGVVEPPLSIRFDGTNFFLGNVFYLKLIVHESSHILLKNTTISLCFFLVYSSENMYRKRVYLVNTCIPSENVYTNENVYMKKCIPRENVYRKRVYLVKACIAKRNVYT